MTEILVPCAACYSRLAITQHELMKDESLRNRIIEATGLDFKGTCTIMNVIEWVEKYIIPQLSEKIVKPFSHPVACYYGCLLVRPAGVVNFDRPEEPRSMDLLMTKLGAEPIDWAFKTECCGAGFSVSRTDLVARLSGLILEDAVARGAEAVIVACPMCHLNLDMRRPNIEKLSGRKYNIPVIYITQAIGLAMGLKPKQLGLQRHKVKVRFGDGLAKPPSASITPASAKPTAGAKSASGDSPAGAGSPPAGSQSAAGDSPAEVPSSGTSARSGA